MAEKQAIGDLLEVVGVKILSPWEHANEQTDLVA
jgi:hypothetical protein